MGGWPCHLPICTGPRDKHILGEKSFVFGHAEFKKMSVRYPSGNGEEEAG